MTDPGTTATSAPGVRPARLRLRDAMVAVAALAVWLALGRRAFVSASLGLVLLAFFSPYVAALAVGLAWFRTRPRAAGRVLGAALVLNNAFVVWLGTNGPSFGVRLVTVWAGLAGLVLTGPAVAARWKTRAETGEPARPWLPALALGLLPFTTLFSPWPLLLAFAASRPALDGLADEVAAGKPLGFPVWAGVYRIHAASFDPGTGTVGLVADPGPGGSFGFVRVGPGGLTPGGPPPFVNLEVDEPLGGPWRYQNED